MTETLTFHVLDANGAHLGFLPSAVGRTILVELNGPGSGKFSINADAPDAALVAAERIVEARWAGSAIFHFVMQRIKRPVVAPTRAGRMIEVSGQGVLSLLRKVVVYPHAWPALTDPDALDAPLVCGPSFGMGFFGMLNGNADLPFTFSFTPTKDSDLATWPNDVNLEFRPGQTMWDVMQALTARGYGMRYEASTRSVDAYVSAGNDLHNVIIFQEGLNILEYVLEQDTLDLATVVLGAGQQAVVESTDFDWTTTRRQAYLQAQNGADEQQVAAANQALLDQVSAPASAYTLVVRNSPRALYDYHIGDTVGVRTAMLGVQAFQVRAVMLEDAGADYRVTLGINSVLMPAEVRQRVASDALAFSQGPGNRYKLSGRDVRTTRPIVTFDWFYAGAVPSTALGQVYRVENRLQVIAASGGCSAAIVTGDKAEIMIRYSLDNMASWADLFVSTLQIAGDTMTLATAAPALSVLQPGTYLSVEVRATGHDSLNDLSLRLRTREI